MRAEMAVWEGVVAPEPGSAEGTDSGCVTLPSVDGVLLCKGKSASAQLAIRQASRVLEQMVPMDLELNAPRTERGKSSKSGA